MFDLEAAKAENLKAQKALDDMGDLLALIVDVSDNKVPQLRNDINEIVKNIKDGFDKEELAKQIRTVLNQVINQSDYSKLQANIDTATKKMIDAVESSSRQVDKWREETKINKIFNWSFSTFVLGLFLGLVFAYLFAFKELKDYQQNDLYKYQNIINYTDSYARYINSSCEIKQSFSNFTNVGTKKFDCNKSWLSASELLQKPQ